MFILGNCFPELSYPNANQYGNAKTKGKEIQIIKRIGFFAIFLKFIIIILIMFAIYKSKYLIFSQFFST